MGARGYATAALAALGFVLGAALMAAGQGADLEGRLQDLQRQAARLRAIKHENTGQLPPADDNGFEYGFVHVGPLVRGVPDHLPPTRDWREDTEAPLFGGVAEEAPQPYGTIEELMELVRTAVRPRVWEESGAISCRHHALVIHHRPDVIEDVRRFVETLRPAVSRTIAVDVEVVEVSGGLAATLAGRTGAELDDATRAALDDAVASGDARRPFAGRVLGLDGQRVVLWDGAQSAVIPDYDVEVAQQAKTADPVVGVENLGGILDVRSTVGGTHGRVRLDLGLEHATLDRPLRMRSTAESGTLQLPASTVLRAEADLEVASGRWAVAAEAKGGAGARRFVLVRPTVHERPRKEGKR